MTIEAGPDAQNCIGYFDVHQNVKEQPDIIHVHNYEAPIVAVIGRYHRKIPMV